MVNKETIPKGHFPKIAFSSILFVTLAFLMGLSWYSLSSYKRIKTFQEQDFRIQELAGIIIHLDEVLTMSARMGAETGYSQWEERYLKFEPQLDAAIKEAERLIPKTFSLEAATETNAANIKLVKMEKQAFEMVRQGQNEAALTLLFSEEYEKQKHIYAEGMKKVTTSIRGHVKEVLKEHRQHDYLTVVTILILLPALIVAWIYILRLIRSRYNIDRKRAEEKYRRLIENLQDNYFFYAHNTEGIFTYISPSLTNILGYSAEEFLTHYSEYLTDNPINEKVVGYTALSIKGIKQTPYEVEIYHKDGSIRSLHVQETPIFDNNRKVIAVEGIAQDITEQKEMEKELVKIQKLESMGMLAGGIAHDFNNSLQSILGYIALAELHASSNNGIQEYLNEARKVVLKSKGLTQQLLTFSRGGEPVKSTISISKLIGDSAMLALSGSNVRCVLGIPDGLWPVEADKGQLNQVISNLIINADQAMPEGGNIKVWAENMNVVEKNLLPLQDGRYVKITIEDRGTGIPEKDLQKIFDPYFTTKQKGSGLGLATAYSIIKKHNGHITVESEIGVGTTFHIYLPASRKAIQKELALSEAKGSDNKHLEKKAEEACPVPVNGVSSVLVEGKGTSITRKRKVLLMDDEYVIRVMLSKQLRHLKYEVEAAEEGSEAIRLYERASGKGKPFDAVVMDLTISGGMGGKEAIKRLLEIDPEVKAIVVSGYANDPIMANYKKYGFSGVLPKPHEIHELDEALQKVMKSM